jgi:acyl-coenzyme A thioesterase PaaI-like protein
MPDRFPKQQRLAMERLCRSARRVLQQVRATTAPPERLLAAAEALERASDLLADYAHPGPFAQHSLDGAINPAADWNDLASVMPYSPIIGALNPISPPAAFSVTDGSVRARVRFPATFAGPAQSVHGGLVAASFDELLAAVNLVNELAAMTGTLTIRYRRPTPLLEDVEMEAHCTGSEGRKVFAHGEMRSGGQVTAEAEGIFIRVQE